MSPVIRQIFIVHSVYIVGIVLLFAVLTLLFTPELSGGTGLGRFLAGAICLFWFCRVPVQLFFYGPELRTQNPVAHWAFASSGFFLSIVYGVAAFGIRSRKSAMTWRPITSVLPLSTAMAAWEWLVLVALRAAHRIDLGIIGILFSLAPLVIVPLGLQLVEAVPIPLTDTRLGHLTQSVVPVCALVAVASFFLPIGIFAALAAIPWLFVCLLNAVSGSLRIFRHGPSPLSRLCSSVGQLYLFIGGIWFLFSRMGARPLGFYEPIVLLTAVHFHYAGFAAPILAGALLRFLRLSDSYQRRALHAAVGCVLIGPALLAAGFVLGPRAKLAAALMLVIGEAGLAAWTLLAVGRVKPRWAQLFLALSAVSVIPAMLFAGLWAVGEYPFQPMLNIPQMAQVHGTINAIGSVFCGVFGWTLHMRYAQPAKESFDENSDYRWHRIRWQAPGTSTHSQWP